ncbi:MAG TPA: TlpA disulfide reductase family protein [Rhodothermales bacterium]|nr:TlpA disulfide reductase family protein [Rhodothermales bacterium]
MFKGLLGWCWAVLILGSSSCTLPGALSHLKLRSSSGESINIPSLRGKVVILDFWASWCSPCVRIMPQLQHFYERYQQHPKVAFVAINNSEIPEEAEAFLQQLGIRYPNYYDIDRKTSAHFRVAGLPTTIMLSPKGEIAFIHRGFHPHDDVVALLSREVDALLAP